MDACVIDFGAKSDGLALCTAEIQTAIDKCSASGGGRVTLPRGLYLTGTLWLRDNVELHLREGATLKASVDMKDYNELDAYPQNFSSPTTEKWLGKHLIVALECKNVALTGRGTLDGSADAFFGEVEPQSIYAWRAGGRMAKDEETLRPGQLVCFIECENVRVSDVTLTNMPCWGCFFHGCTGVTAHGIKVFNPETYMNTDGIDIDCCAHVRVSDCIIDTGDDAIAIRGSNKKLKNPDKICEDVVVSDCEIGSASAGIRIGVGTGVIRNVQISNIKAHRAAPIVSIMSSYFGHGSTTIEDVKISNLTAESSNYALELIEGTDVPIRNILLENFSITTDGFMSLESNFPSSVSGVTLKNWDVTLVKSPPPVYDYDIKKHGTAWLRARNINNLVISDFTLRVKEDALSSWCDGAFSFTDCNDRKISDTKIIDIPS
ncbi:MAG: hypothetical protein IJW03_02325 [Clostridia bacterium]|nr:hypothetical protein [Clostridia bacterium]